MPYRYKRKDEIEERVWLKFVCEKCGECINIRFSSRSKRIPLAIKGHGSRTGKHGFLSFCRGELVIKHTEDELKKLFKLYKGDNDAA